MQFGTKVKDEAPRTNSGSGNGKWIKAFKKGETRIRFLEEMEDWTVYYEHYNPGKQRSYPCTGERSTCPGCTSDVQREKSASRRYLVNALVAGYVDLYKIPVSLIDRLDRRSDADGGTIMKRDYTIIRLGSGGEDTEYDVEKEDVSKVDLSQYLDKFQDHQKALYDAYVEANGVPGEKPQAAPEEEKPKWNDDPDSMPGLSKESASDPDPSEDDEETLSEDVLRAMSADEIKALYGRCGFSVPDTDDTDALADQLIELLS